MTRGPPPSNRGKAPDRLQRVRFAVAFRTASLMRQKPLQTIYAEKLKSAGALRPEREQNLK
jgi:hypothetical protein